MKNPYKSFSKVRPDPKRGFRQIATDVFYALNMCPKLSGSDYKIIYTIIGLSWGYQKTSVIMSYNQISKLTNLSRFGVIKSASKLVNNRILVKEEKLVNNRLPLVEWMVNKYYDTWVDKTGQQLFTSSMVQLVNELSVTGQQNVMQLVNNRTTLCKKERKKESAGANLNAENELSTLKGFGMEPNPEVYGDVEKNNDNGSTTPEPEPKTTDIEPF